MPLYGTILVVLSRLHFCEEIIVPLSCCEFTCLLDLESELYIYF